MKADLPSREPAWLEYWDKSRIYERGLEAGAGRPVFTLHDGPPYANGPIHMGHALNKTLKDIIVRYKTLCGFQAPFVPGWDCHGLPIEQALLKELKISKKEAAQDPLGFRKKCREFVGRMIELQREDFRRLGLMGRWQNPYITMEPPYACKIVEAFIRLRRSGQIYRGLKPVFWCIHCETALAQAEVEYAGKTSPSIFVKFRSQSVNNGLPPNLFALVWTTTPWTLPANQALLFDPKLQYVIVRLNRQDEPEHWILAACRVKPVLTETMKMSSGTDYTIVDNRTGTDLEQKIDRWEHPLFLGESPAGRFKLLTARGVVSEEEGTGIVHMAPGHGEIDFKIAHQEGGLEVLSPIDGRGEFTEASGRPELIGASIKSDANDKVCELLGPGLAHRGQVQHSYPHCWRCKNPLIFRATEQWFLNIDKPLQHTQEFPSGAAASDSLRKALLEQIDSVDWFPPGSKERIRSMVQTRPDWCLSRQRLWGAPIPILYCKSCGEEKADGGLDSELVDRVRREGEDYWFDPKAGFLKEWGKKYPCAQCGGCELVRDPNILDVWMDSGVSWYAVLMSPPADLYLEGSDQHRGWFQTSLITATALTGRAPYKAVFTNGWVLDEQGRAMHKSLGNVVSPQQIVARWGADVLRLWAAGTLSTDDVRVSENVLKLHGENYRKLRNTLRYLLGNLHGFQPQKNGVCAYDEVERLERWALANLARCIQECRDGYEAYDFPRVVRALLDFAIHDLSNFYLDISKDRLYTFKLLDPDRVATQTVFFVTLHHLLILMAPILPFTAEEAWQEMIKLLTSRDPLILLNVQLDFPDSCHQARFPGACADWNYEGIRQAAGLLSEIRAMAHRQMDSMRQEGSLGGSLEAKITVKASKKDYALLHQWRSHLPTLLIVSDVELEGIPGPDAKPQLIIGKAVGSKCERCWVRHESVGQDSRDPNLCAKCAKVLFD